MNGGPAGPPFSFFRASPRRPVLSLPEMKRRHVITALAAAPAAAPLAAQQASAPIPLAVPQAPNEAPKLSPSAADAAGETVPRFFSATQLATLQKLSSILMPPMNNAPGALECGAPEFLDFLIGQSSSETQQVYRIGLDTLNSSARKRFRKQFAELDPAQADQLLAPLREPFTIELPADPLKRFLLQAKRDVRLATTNSREFNLAGASSGARRFGASGLYWLPLD